MNEEGLLLVASVNAALKNGCRHYDEAGKLLATTREVVSALVRDGAVTLDERDRQERTTTEHELKLLKEWVAEKQP